MNISTRRVAQIEFDQLLKYQAWTCHSSTSLLPSSLVFGNDNPAIDTFLDRLRNFSLKYGETRRDTERHHFTVARPRSSRGRSSKYLDLLDIPDIRELERNVPLALVNPHRGVSVIPWYYGPWSAVLWN
ncbi:hypothetical protein K0M31_005500 [Melipona bicolor]|uniref:Uncharacterized protein n=1 Tax=Melipona bicolor TaxID=60889 RepID=A0AA40FVR6_9HYME|nr:hypothetical protein K0M31_005500 [Melipona bicolor]